MPILTQAEHWANVAQNHRGPYSLMLVREFATKPGFYRSEWTPGSVDADSMIEEAMALLTDPRDTIDRISVWSDREDQFVFCFWRDRD